MKRERRTDEKKEVSVQKKEKTIREAEKNELKDIREEVLRGGGTWN